jgi:hypothetical protein
MRSPLRRSRDHQFNLHSRDLRRLGMPDTLRPSAEPEKTLTSIIREHLCVKRRSSEEKSIWRMACGR